MMNRRNAVLDYLIKSAADPGMAAGAPPMDPAMMGGGMPPMDPSMMGGGAPPMDPAMMGGGGMPPMDPSMMGGGMPPMDPSMMGGMPPMDPSMMGGMPLAGAPADPTATAAGAEAKASTKIKTEQWMAHIDSYCYNMLNLMIELFNQLNLKVPAESLLQRPLDQAGPSADELSKMMSESISGPPPMDALTAATGGVPAGGSPPPMEAPKTAAYHLEDSYPDSLFFLMNQIGEFNK